VVTFSCEGELKGSGMATNFKWAERQVRPSHPSWLTPEEFTARFGPTEQDYQAVKDFAKSKGLTTTPCGTRARETVYEN
jgi:hypothetical protein